MTNFAKLTAKSIPGSPGMVALFAKIPKGLRRELVVVARARGTNLAIETRLALQTHVDAYKGQT